MNEQITQSGAPPPGGEGSGMRALDEDFTASVPESWRGKSRHFRPRLGAHIEAPRFPWKPALIMAAGLTAIFIAAFILGDPEVIQFLFIGVLVLIGAVIYFIPTMVAGVRKHRNRNGIILLNIFFGWTLLGWVGALIWAVWEEKK